MKKTEAARLYWFNYTARRRHEEHMRRENLSISKKFSHGLVTATRSIKVMLINFWLKIQWYFKRLVKKVA